MKKILLIGSGPLPIEKNTLGTAFGLRTWQFLKPLLQQENIEVSVILLAFSEKYHQQHPILTRGQYEATPDDLYLNIFKYQTLKKIQIFDKAQAKSSKLFQQIYNQIKPDVLIGINIQPAFVASRIKRQCPLWVDFNGWTMAEAQAQAALWQSNELLSRLWHMEKTALLNLDRCSVVSLPQKHATIGELATMGRLNQWTHAYSFVEVIENAMDEELKEIISADAGTDTTILKQIGYKPEHKIVLSIGAFNTWIDSKTLLQGLEMAMQKNRQIIFVNTGEGMPGLSQKYYEQFVTDCSKSKYADRIKNPGWVERSQLNTLLQHASIGINIDLPIYETFFGARNRINEYLLWNLPILTTKGSAIANTLIQTNAAIGIDSQNPQQFAEKLCYFLDGQHHNELEIIGKKAKECKQTLYSTEVTTKPFLEWLKVAAHAPDFNKPRQNLEKQNQVKQVLLYLRRNGLYRTIQKIFMSNTKK